jgi:hypothetical protein
LDASIKGVFHKFLVQSLTSLTNIDFILRKVYKSGKVVDAPEHDAMLSFAVSSKEGGGLRSKYAPVIENGKPLYVEGKPVMTALPSTGYTQNLTSIFSTLFGDRLSKDFFASHKNKFWSFVGLAEIINILLETDEKNKIVNSFIKKVFGPSAQGLYRNDPERDKNEKMVALNKLLAIIQVDAPADLDNIVSTYVEKYKYSE